MREDRYWRCESCRRLVMDFNRPLGKEEVRPFVLTEDDCNLCLDCAEQMEPEAPDGR